VITSSAKAQGDPYARIALVLSIAIVGGLCLLSMWRVIRLVERRSTLGLVLPRIMGLVLAVIAVQFMITGLELILPRLVQAAAK
jgi:small neutral amino acid transporter SnatA (MarC family)